MQIKVFLSICVYYFHNNPTFISQIPLFRTGYLAWVYTTYELVITTGNQVPYPTLSFQFLYKRWSMPPLSNLWTYFRHFQLHKQLLPLDRIGDPFNTITILKQEDYGSKFWNWSRNAKVIRGQKTILFLVKWSQRSS